MLKSWLIASLALNAAFIGVRVRTLIDDKYLPHSSEPIYSRFHVERTAVFEGLPVPKGAVLAFGDSLIQNCEWSELLGLPVANRGISGDNTTSLLAAVPSLGDLREVGSVLLVAGANDLGEGVEVEPFIARYRALLNALRVGAPRARIIVHGLLPVNPAIHASLQTLPAKFRSANTRLSQLASAMGLQFFDASSAFTDSSGLMDRRYTVDGLHLNGAGYRVWANVLRPLLIQ